MRKFTKEISALLASAAMGATAFSGTASAVTVNAEPAANQPVQTTAVTTGCEERIGTEMPVTGYDPCEDVYRAGEMAPEDILTEGDTTTMMGTMVTTTTVTTEDNWDMIGTTVSQTTPTTTMDTTDCWDMIGTTGTMDYWDMIGTTVSESTTTTTTTTTKDQSMTEMTGTVYEEDIPPLAGVVQMPDGDINVDGKTNISDAILLSRVLAEDPTVQVTPQGLDNADMNNSGAPDKEDVVILLKELAGLI